MADPRILYLSLRKSGADELAATIRRGEAYLGIESKWTSCAILHLCVREEGGQMDDPHDFFTSP